MKFIIYQIAKLTGIGVTIILLTSCAQSKVGGELKISKKGGEDVTHDFNTQCDGKCAEMSPSGKCVKFTSDISDVCIRFFERANRLPVSTGDCSPYIGNVGGDVTVTYNKEC